MRKIMFNDKYGLTAAVLERSKTMTRRLVKSDNIVSITTSDGAVHHVDKTSGSYHEYMDKDGKVWLAWSPYKVGETVAVAEPYETVQEEMITSKGGYGEEENEFYRIYKDAPGWTNKMFVRADLMPHKIQITDIKMERLQDISEEDCMKEGVLKYRCIIGFAGEYVIKVNNKPLLFHTPREAFADLIDKVSGKGTWERNPWVFAYEFKLVK